MMYHYYIIIISVTLARSLESVVTECKKHTTHTHNPNSPQKKARNKTSTVHEKRAPTVRKIRMRPIELQDTSSYEMGQPKKGFKLSKRCLNDTDELGRDPHIVLIV
ncbi:unnamed protein product [Sphacelaria rigidula]